MRKWRKFKLHGKCKTCKKIPRSVKTDPNWWRKNSYRDTRFSQKCKFHWKIIRIRFRYYKSSIRNNIWGKIDWIDWSKWRKILRNWNFRWSIPKYFIQTSKRAIRLQRKKHKKWTNGILFGNRLKCTRHLL